MRTVTIESLDRYQQRVTTDRHTLISDEPEPTGAGAGLSPYELLLAALGS